jgi:NAD(P)-dependent dehydrogenase (short-subunit alcohol dehydrogenase family)
MVDMEFKQKLNGKIALVAGATRGAGRGIACMLGEAGATVYCTGRSVKGSPSPVNRPETIEETAEMVTLRGGKGIYVQVDHTDRNQVQELFERVRQEQDGHLDILVNDMTGEAYMEIKSFPEHSIENGIKHQRDLAYSETPFYIGKAVVALACDKRLMRKSGQSLVSGKLAREYRFTDIDGTQPIWCY